jgi:hypothetical protein
VVVAIRIAVIALFGSLIVFLISVAFYRQGSEAFLQWISTLLGTLVGALLAALIGVTLFYYQRSKRRLELLSALLAELEATLDILNPGHSIALESPDMEEREEEEPAVQVVVTRLVPVACEEHIRTALLSPQDIFFLVHLNRAMCVYDAEAEHLSSIMSEPAADKKQYYQLKKRAYKAAKQLKNHQNEIVRYCKLIIPVLRNKSVPGPATPRYYSQDKPMDSSD